MCIYIYIIISCLGKTGKRKKKKKKEKRGKPRDAHAGDARTECVLLLNTEKKGGKKNKKPCEACADHARAECVLLVNTEKIKIKNRARRAQGMHELNVFCL